MFDRKEAKFVESRGRDDYGRSVLTVTVYHPEYNGVHARGVVVTLPKFVRQERPNEAYLVNNWAKPAREGVTYHAKRAAAVAHLKEELLQALELKDDSVELTKLMDLGDMLNRVRVMANDCKATERDVYNEVAGALQSVARKVTGDNDRGDGLYQRMVDGTDFRTAVREEAKEHAELMKLHAEQEAEVG